MTAFYSNEMGGVASPSPRLIDQGAKQQLSVVRHTFTLNTQTTSDTLNLVLPAGFRPRFLALTPSVTLGSSTLAIGAAGKYRAAAVLTAPSFSALPLGGDGKLTANTAVPIAIAEASLPASGTLVVEFYGTYD
jgi:hypothetical protein